MARSLGCGFLQLFFSLSIETYWVTASVSLLMTYSEQMSSTGRAEEWLHGTLNRECKFLVSWANLHENAF